MKKDNYTQKNYKTYKKMKKRTLSFGEN